MQILTINRERLKEEVHLLKTLSFECKTQKVSSPGWVENIVKEYNPSQEILFQNPNFANKARGTKIYG